MPAPWLLLKGVFVRNEPMPFNLSPCIINLDDFGKLGTHWVCCWCNADEFEYFDSFGLPNNCQIQWIGGECCRWYCLLFLNKPYEGRVFSQVLDMFTADTERALHCLSVCRETGRWQRNSLFFHVVDFIPGEDGTEEGFRGVGMSPPTNVSWVQFPDPASYVG